MTPAACDACLRRSALIGFLGARLSAVLGGLDRRLGGVLALEDDELIAAVAGRQTDEAHRFCAEFDGQAARRSLHRVGMGAVCRHQRSYPEGLHGLADPPPVIYLTGTEGVLDRMLASPTATVVGARSPSRHAHEVARELGRDLAVAGVTVASGLALGVDAAAHRGVLEGGGRPLVVLAGGADVPYPKTNRALYERVRREGIVISELPPRQRPLRWSFPARNRIMAALAGLTVVVEAAEASGSLITADFATQLGREVGAVPGHVTSRLAAGSNRLLREGAAVIRSAEDALDELHGVVARERLAVSTPPVEPERCGRQGHAAGPTLIPTQASRDGHGLSSEQPPGAEAISRHSPLPGLETSLRRVLDLVEGEETIDGIGRRAGLAPAAVRAALGRLELMGLVARDGLAGYVRTAG